jgi:hypothetical protein
MMMANNMLNKKKVETEEEPNTPNADDGGYDLVTGAHVTKKYSSYRESFQLR